MAIDLKHTLLSRPPKNDKFYIVAIDGLDGSGKSTLIKYLPDILAGFEFINGDDYFEPTPDGETFGSFNEDRFNQDVISPLKLAETSFAYRPYDWHAEPHISERKVSIGRGICIERCRSFLFELDFDLKIWVETPKEVRFERVISRDAMPRDEIEAALNIWQQQGEEFIAKIKPLESADIIIDGTQPSEAQLK
jgi:uridine kinase